MNTDSVAVVLGTRPEIIKTAPVMLQCQQQDIPLEIIHTGQHYSESMDDVFFEQLQLPTPGVNLDIGAGSHGEQTGKMLERVESRLRNTNPKVVIVQGDTNSALAGALAACKLDIEIAHIEAGLRSFDREMPEETNRILIDNVADYLFAPTDRAADQLREEGIPDSRITVTGNTIADAVQQYSKRATMESTILESLNLEAGDFCLLTAHRAENVDDPGRFESLLTGVDNYAQRAEMDVIYPIHPRARKQLKEFNTRIPDSIRLIEPLEFFDFLRLEATASLVFTDSGGVQEECCILETPCVTLRFSTERPETVHVGANCIAGLDPQEIVTAAEQMSSKQNNWNSPFGDGRASERILADLDPRSTSESPESVSLPTL